MKEEFLNQLGGVPNIVELNEKHRKKTIITPGIYKDLTSEEYHSDTESISRSAIMTFLDSPHKYWSKYLNPEKRGEIVSKNMELGTAFHALILELKLFEKQYSLEPELLPSPKRVLLKNVGRPAYDAYKAEKIKVDFINDKSKEDFAEYSEGTKILTREDWELLKAMKNALENHSQKDADGNVVTAMDLIKDGIYEQSYFWIDEGSGLLVKSRPDVLHNNMYVDLKTCASASPRAYQRSFLDGGYGLQAAMARDAVRVLEGRELSACINVCVETKWPHEVAIKIIRERALDKAESEYKQALLNIKAARENNYFPSYEVEEVDYPEWYYNA